MKKLKKIPTALLASAFLIILGGYITIPRLVKYELSKKAKSYGLDIQPSNININLNQIILNDVSISSPFSPNQTAKLKKITVKMSWFKPKHITVSHGKIKLNGTPDLLKRNFLDWKNRNRLTNTRSRDKSNFLNKLTVEGVSIIWDNWRPASILKINNISLRNGIISTGSITAQIANRILRINNASYDPANPRKLHLEKATITRITNETIKDQVIKSIARIPKIPYFGKLIIDVDEFTTQYGKLNFNLKHGVFSLNHGDLIGIDVQTDQVGINGINLDKLRVTIVLDASDQPRILVDASAASLKFAHKALLDHEIDVARPGANLQIMAGKDRIEIVSGHIDIDNARFSITGSYDSKWIRGRLSLIKVNCQDLLDSIPMAMKPIINDMKLDGQIGWDLQTDIDLPDKSNISVRVKLDNKCKITHVPDKLSISKLRKQFKRFAYDAKNKLVEVESGPNTSGWTPIGLTSLFVPIAIMTMEDQNFMVHHGFDIRAIENSIRDNIKEWKFAKGASTVTMQLAKNLWLNRGKTISRKVQEAFLTMYLEQEMRKDEILQLYINVVEFGPNIYGIGGASQHYFHKHPYDLSLGQAMFLASILPKPKAFYFGINGELIPGKLKFLHKAMKAMRDKNLISDDEYEQGTKEIITFGRSSTNDDKIEEIVTDKDGINPDSWKIMN